MMHPGVSVCIIALSLVSWGLARPTTGGWEAEDILSNHVHTPGLYPRADMPRDVTGLVYDTSIPRYPLPPVGTTWIGPSQNFPGLNITLVSYHNASCPSSPMWNYRFLNGTLANATLGDQVLELKTAFKPGNEKMIQKYMEITQDIAWETYQLANDTLEWINWTDKPGDPDSALLPGESLLPMPDNWFPKGWFDEPTLTTGSLATSKTRRASSGGDVEMGIVERPLGQRPSRRGLIPGDDPPRGPEIQPDPAPDIQPDPEDQHAEPSTTHTVPGLAPFPRGGEEGGQIEYEANENENAGDVENQHPPRNEIQASGPVVRGYKERAWDVFIILFGSLIGAALSYGLLEAGTHVFPVNRKPELSNMFAAMSLAVGIITGVIIGVIQKYRIDMFSAAAAQNLRNTVKDMNDELRSLRGEMKELAAKSATKAAQSLRPKVPVSEIAEEVTETLIKKPYQEIKVASKTVIMETGQGLKRVGSSFGSAGNIAAGVIDRAVDSMTSLGSGGSGGSGGNGRPGPSGHSDPGPSTLDPGPSSASDPGPPTGSGAETLELDYQDEAGIERNPRISALQMTRARTAPRLCPLPRQSEDWQGELDSQDFDAGNGSPGPSGKDVVSTR